jgi:hypothetical protein
MDAYEELVAEVRTLRAEVAALRRENGHLRQAPPSETGGLTRRRMLQLAGGVVGGGAVLAVAGGQPASATTGTMQYGSTLNDAGISETMLTSICDSPTLALRNNNTNGQSDISQALNCFSAQADGMASSAGLGGGNGVYGFASNRTKSGVRGEHTTGTGVSGAATTGVAVAGKATKAGSRGGTFQGIAAAVQLVASAQATHPKSGRRGDLFVDSSGRLWFCKGTTTWRQLA